MSLRNTKILQAALALFLALALIPAAMADKSAGDRVDDGWLHTKVKTALVGHASTDINIEIYKGHVQLAGFIMSEAKKDDALAQLTDIKGVVEIHDQIVVVDPDRSAGRTLDDGVLEGSVKKALLESDLTKDLSVNIDVNRGVVLLSGWVDTKEQRGNALTVAETVQETVEVLNGIDLKP